MQQNYFNELKELIKNASAAFSGIKVAAIIITDKGIFKGVNYEDSICSLSSCAERNAILNGITNGMKEIYEVHILPSKEGITMCGACRQMVSGFAHSNCKIFTYSNSGQITKENFSDLLPSSTLLASKQ